MPHPFNRLLLATEHSEYDAGSERLAFELARRCGLPLAAVLPITSNPEYEALAPQIAAHAEAQAAERMRALNAQAQLAGVALDLHARRGPEPYQEIIEEARERACDLLVIRRRGKRGILARLLVGEMVSKVVAHAPCSVLVTPRGGRMWSRRVLVAVDPQALHAEVVVPAAAIAAECGLPLTIVVVTDSAAPERKQMADRALQQGRALAEAAGCPVDLEWRTGRIHEQILDAAARWSCDLIVMGRHGDDRIARAWLGGVTQKVVGMAEQPVLVAAGAAPSIQEVR